MKILFLTFYFPPDLSAGSFRSSSLVEALLKNSNKNIQIDIVTTIPNRYRGFQSFTSNYTKNLQHTIYAINIPKHKSGIVDQSWSFLIYAKEVIKLVNYSKYDLVFATSGRLMTAVLGAYLSRKFNKPLYLDIRDIFVDAIKYILPKYINFFTQIPLSLAERYAIQSASKINLVSGGFLPYFKKKYPNQKFEIFSNGIDNEFIVLQSKIYKKNNDQKMKVIYAGNIGESQGLHRIIPKLGRRYKDKLEFEIIGDGGKREELIKELKNLDCKNVTVLPPVKRQKLAEIYQSADILFLHLNDYEAFKKVLPSKLFEYGATGKPIWAGVSGYAEKFISENLENVAIFSPCVEEQAVSSFESLELASRSRDQFIKKFSRNEIMKSMSLSILELVRKK